MLTSRGRIAHISLQTAQLPRDPNAGRRLRARLSLPVRGTWWVLWGGSTKRNAHAYDGADQRHAYDLLIWRGGATHRGSGTRNSDYWAWGAPVLAPAGGIVVSAVDGVRDHHPVRPVDNGPDSFGNHVVLDLGTDEYAVLASMQNGSVRVRTGERVQRGDVLGRVGNSARATGPPNLHFHIQDGSKLFKGRGLPVTFVDYRADGRRVASGTPLQGQFIQQG